MRRRLAIMCVLFVGISFISFPAPASAYARCNCTAWAYYKRRDLGLKLGNALTWGVRAKKLGFRVDGKPRAGDVMVLQPGVQGAHRRYGHVAYVVGVKGNRVFVTEMNGGQGCRVRQTVYRVTRGVAFIHPRW